MYSVGDKFRQTWPLNSDRVITITDVKPGIIYLKRSDAPTHTLRMPEKIFRKLILITYKKVNQ